MKNLAMIACISTDWGIGKDDQLLWHIPEDMQFFKHTTMGHPVIMGGNTFRSIGKPLPKRENIVLSRSRIEASGVKQFSDLADLRKYLQSSDEEKFIIGGASLYATFLDDTETLYLTEVEATRPADTFFPEFQREKFSRHILQSGEHEGTKYHIIEYKRK